MNQAISDAVDQVTPTSTTLRGVNLARAAVLICAGLAIAFTATLHENLIFDQWVVTISYILLGFVAVAEYASSRSTSGSWRTAAHAVLAFAAALTLSTVALTPAVFAVTIMVWAVATAVVTLMKLIAEPAARNTVLPSALLSLLLAFAVMLFQDDAVAVIGFFGAYAIVRGVFLGIGVFDPKPADAQQQTTSSTQNESTS